MTLGFSSRITARIAPKSRSLVRTTWSCSAAHFKRSLSRASFGPTFVQWIASNPASAKNSIQRGDKFMSTRILIRPQEDQLRVPEIAKQHNAALQERRHVTNRGSRRE